jgi:hypothetical protein
MDRLLIILPLYSKHLLTCLEPHNPASVIGLLDLLQTNLLYNLPE